MLTLILTARLMSGSRCETYRIPAPEADLPARCSQAMTEWAVEHPNWIVQRWTCRREDRGA